MLTDDRQEAFFLVWNPKGQNPKRRHEHEYQATAEAERLARANPGEEFYVMEARELRVMESMKRVMFVHPIPF